MSSLKEYNNLFQHATVLMNKHEYNDAKSILQKFWENPKGAEKELIALARCELALANEPAAQKIYHFIQSHSSAMLSALSEAALIFDKLSEAIHLLNQAIKKEKENPELYFLLAIAYYKSGYIQRAKETLERVIALNFEWQDEDPVDFVVQNVLPIPEFHDFEQIYLDVGEYIIKKSINPQNRWFSINMPIYDFLLAKNGQQQNKRSLEIIQLLSPQFNADFMKRGKEELNKILDDLSKSKNDNQFGIEVKNAWEKNNLQRVAKLVLAVELDHLKQFASLFGLTADYIDKSHLYDLIPLLPLRLAIILMLLYSCGNPDDTLKEIDYSSFNTDLISGLIAASFISYYQQIHIYNNKKTNIK